MKIGNDGMFDYVFFLGDVCIADLFCVVKKRGEKGESAMIASNDKNFSSLASIVGKVTRPTPVALAMASNANENNPPILTTLVSARGHL